LREKLISKLATEVVPSSNVIEISLKWKDPSIAEIALGEIMKQYLIYRQEVLNPAEKGSFFSKQVGLYLKAMEDNQKKFLALIRQKKAPDATLQIQNNLTLRLGLEGSLQTLRAERLQSAAEIRLIDGKLGGEGIEYFSFLENQVVRDLGRQLQVLALERSTAIKTYLPGTPPLESINNQIKTANKELRDSAVSYRSELFQKLKNADIQIDAIQKKIKETDERNLELREFSLLSERLKQEQQLLSFSFETFYKRREEAKIGLSRNESGVQSQVIVLGNARAGATAFFPEPKRLIPIGLIAAIFTGIAAGFIANFFDTTVKRPSEIEEVYGIPVLFAMAPFHNAPWIEKSENEPPPWQRFFTRYKTAGFVFASLLVCVLAVYGLIRNPAGPSDNSKMIAQQQENTTRAPSVTLALNMAGMVSEQSPKSISDTPVKKPKASIVASTPLVLPPEAPGINVPPPSPWSPVGVTTIQ
jgi:polysaccharide biosynthesis protein PslE